jgi:hypothetical protein
MRDHLFAAIGLIAALAAAPAQAVAINFSYSGFLRRRRQPDAGRRNRLAVCAGHAVPA